jgi:3-deoxy-7-phosphoheptulonate synthase
MVTTDNIHVESLHALHTPAMVRGAIPISEALEGQITESRRTVEAILDRRDTRKLVIVGPCAVYDTEATLEYARRLAALANEVRDTLYVVMRVYFEKPRTTTGWKGLINDPRLDDSFHVEEGLYVARRLLVSIAELGLPIATEALDPIVPQYIGDIVTWTAIGARTAESQTHREMASGLSSPVGFKNGTDGNILVAMNGILSAAHPHRFLGINQHGQCSVVHTRGNSYGHLVLRGGKAPNYDTDSITAAANLMHKHGLVPNIIVDCSHGNSNKDHVRQALVFRHVLHQAVDCDSPIIGWMLESNLNEGRQDLGAAPLQYGVSITDACISWDTTEGLIREAHRALHERVMNR